MNRLLKHTHWNFRHVLLLLLLTLICYWPLTFGLFSAKNDNILQFLPVRFHVSEALRNGLLPLWSPYMYTGFPIHGDMQGGAWNPVVWFLSFFGRYNLTSLHFEILIALFISAIGMYRLLKALPATGQVSFIGAAVYMMCGFMTDVAGSNLPFLWGAAYTPFVFAYYYELLRNPSLRPAIKTSVALSLLFVSAYPSFFILSVYILLAGFLVVLVKVITRKERRIKNLLIYNACLVVLFTALSSVAILSYWHVLPFYDRGSGVTVQDIFVNSFELSCSASLIFPNLPFKNPESFATDLISRNSYFNIVFLLFLPAYAWMKRSLLVNFIFAGMIFFFLFSLGELTPVRKACYYLLPLMDTFRHPSNARLYVIIGGIIAGCIIFQRVVQDKAFRPLRFIYWTALTGIIICLVAGIAGSTLSKTINEIQSGSLRASLKNFFDQLSLSDVLVVNAMIQFLTIVLLLLLVRNHFIRRGRFSLLIIANSFVFAQLAIPFTLVSKVSPRPLNELLHSFPKNYPAPGIETSLYENSIDVLENFDTIGISGFYNKKIANTGVAFTPTFMEPVEQVLKDSFLFKLMFENSWVYLADEISSVPKSDLKNLVITQETALLNANNSTGGTIALDKMNCNSFDINVNSSGNSVLVLQQLFIPGWHCQVDGRRARIYNANHAFMAILIPPGKHEVKFYYRPAVVTVGAVISLLSMLILIFLYKKAPPAKDA